MYYYALGAAASIALLLMLVSRKPVEHGYNRGILATVPGMKLPAVRQEKAETSLPAGDSGRGKNLNHQQKKIATTGK